MNFFCSFVFLTSIVLLFISCQNVKEDLRNAELIRKLNATEIFTRDICPSVDLDLLQKEENYFGLNSLSHGVDSIEIRIRFYESMATSRLFILKHNGKKWNFDLVTFGVYTLDSVSGHKTIVHPRSGVNGFINKIFRLHVFSLRDITLFRGYREELLANSSTDGNAAIIEIATQKTYKCYEYDQPESLYYKYWQARNILMFVKLLKREFGIIDKWMESMKVENVEDTINIKNRTKR
jgi:hypothetical protein